MQRRILQVGAAPSGIGTAWLRSIQEAPDWTLAGIVDARADHLRMAAERAGLSSAQCFATMGEATTALEFDACALIVPSPLHGTLCEQALEAGKHVIVEKPFATDFAQARVLSERAEQRGLRIMVDQNYRYVAQMGTLRRAVREKIAGVPVFVAVSFDCLWWPGRPYQWDMADTMLLEMAVHHFDSLRYILGAEARMANGRTWRPSWTRYQGDTFVECLFEFDGGIRVAYHGSLESPGARTPWQGIWRVECSDGALHVADMGSGYGVYVSHDPDSVERIEPLAEDGVSQDSSILWTLHEFATALQEGRRPQSDARDNLRTLAIAFAVSRSSAERRSVDIDHEFFPRHPPGL
jgi:predicted dehydrogenase